MKPNFLVIGAQKCGTSDLGELIWQYPDAFVTNPKDPYLFSHDDVWDRN